MVFQLDTSGHVETDTTIGGKLYFVVRWSDLSPFTQGYIEALFQSVRVDALGATFAERPTLSPRFSDLAPEALARIIADCEEYQRIHADLIGISRHPEGLPRLGRLFWIDRQNATVAPFPPLTVQLGDDGKVYLS